MLCMSKLLKKAGVFIAAFAAMTKSPAFPSSGKNDSTNLVSFIFCALVWSIARVECCGVLFFFFFLRLFLGADVCTRSDFSGV